MNLPLNGFSTLLKSLWTGRPVAQRSERRKRKALLGIEAFEDRTLLTAYVVDTLADSPTAGAGDTDGFISLREAIEAANRNTAFGDAPAGQVGGRLDVITFSVVLNDSRILLGGMQLTIKDDVTIIGPGADLLTLDAQGNSRVFSLEGLNAPNGTLEVQIAGLSVTGGHSEFFGGGISNNRGSLRLEHVLVHDNIAQAHGGGVASFLGTTHIVSSAITGNSATRAGAVDNEDATTLIVNSTVSGNFATKDGGGVRLADSGRVIIANSTITRNIANSNNNSEGTGGGLTGDGILIHNSIVAGNMRTTNGIADDIAGTVDATSSFSLVGDSATAGGLSNGSNGNIIGVNGSGTRDINTILNTVLEYNAGRTPIHWPVAGSPAIDNGNSMRATEDGQINGTPLTFDQVGNTRVSNVVDIGAVETQIPGSLVVSTLLDENDGDFSDGDLSLREAIEIANSRPGSESVTFRNDLVGTILLGGTQLDISDDVAIAGPGARILTIDANNASRIFYVAPDSTVEISGLELTGGQAGAGLGGAIQNNGNLKVRSLYVHGNQATTGGGIESSGTGAELTVIDSTIAANLANGFGGGIAQAATAFIANSTLSQNVAENDGGGFLNFGIAVVVNSTIVKNQANGVGGGGVVTGTVSSTTLFNTIVAGNKDDVGAAFDLRGKNVEPSSSHNLIGDGATAGGLSDGVNGNIVGVGGTGTRDINTILNTTLANNGGRTPTHLLALNSPALNAGDNGRATVDGTLGGTVLATDQRGLVRVSGGTVDIGAVEMFVPSTLVVSTLNDESDGDFSDGDLSLREAIEIANHRAGLEEITFQEGLFGSISLYGEQLFINDDLIITGPGSGLLEIDAQQSSRVFHVAGGANVAIGDVTVRGGVPTSSPAPDNLPGANGLGGGILNDRSTLTVQRVVIKSNQGTHGGGINNYANGGAATSYVIDSVISGNGASTNGGGIYNDQGELVVINSTVSGNISAASGGGINSYRGTVGITNSTIVGNRTLIGVGGGVFISDLTVAQSNLQNTLVAGNYRETGSSPDDIFGMLGVRSSFNLIGDSGSAGGLVDGENGNIVGVSGSGVRDINTILNTTLADNGGPTPTHALVTGSPAIDGGNTVKAVDANGDTLLFDQRGFRRVFDGNGDGKLRVDIGAVEAPPEEVTGGLVFDQSNGSFRLATVVSQSVNWFQSGSLGSHQLGFIGDFDGDGLLDGMTLNPNNLRFNFFKNNGNGTLANPVSAGTLSSDYTWGNFMVGDFDGDGREEVMSQILSGPKGVGSMRSQNFNGTSQFYIRLATGYEAFVAGDFNGDGIDDILGLFDNVAETRSNIIPIISISTPVGRRMTAILASGQFGQSVATGGLHDLTVADFNGDGRDDIAVVSSSGQVLTASSTGTPRINAPDARNFIVSNTSPRFNPATYSNIIMAGNFDNDILADLFTIHDAGHLVTTSSTLTPNNLPVQTAAVDGTQSAGDKAIIGDFDGNGYDDVAVLGTNTVVFFSNGTTFNAGIDFGTVIGGPIGQIGAARTGRVL
ncbi:MAG: VCBS repeat-containing protein [Planctomycetaceae bacterium]|nr:VCBS repeat-containing protein [Planctomycetaceae bacterium]MCB9952223.1 VCBS repeat-containing protein [Planctomycetaceae bacterium]